MEAEPDSFAKISSLPLIWDVIGLDPDAPILATLAEGKTIKSGKLILRYLILATEMFPDLATEFKEQASSALSAMEISTILAIRGQRLKRAFRILSTVDRAFVSGLKLAHRRSHQIRLLQIHAYLSVAAGKVMLAIQYIEQSKLLEGNQTPVLLRTTNRLLEAYLYALQLDHKIAIRILRESLGLQTRHYVPDQIGSTTELNWFFRLLIITLYNLSVESVNLHLRTDALQYIQKAKQIVEENAEIAVSLAGKIDRLSRGLSPQMEEIESAPIPTEESEEVKFPFIPGGKVTEVSPGKIVEVTQEEAKTPSNHRFPRVSNPTKVVQKSSNPYLQTQDPAKRYRSVPPTQRRKVGF